MNVVCLVVGFLDTMRIRVAILAVVLAACGGSSDHSASTPPLRVVTSTATAIATNTLPPPPSRTPTATASSTFTASSTSTPSPTVARTPVGCAALSGAVIGGARLTAATLVTTVESAPEYCKVAATIDPALNFELRLPATWNRKALFLGGAGYDGVIPIPDVLRPGPGVVSLGYATIATDSGHYGSPLDGSFALDPAALDDFAQLARHRVLAAAREIVLVRYAEPLRRAYFEGGSSGGREALIEAQRWPDDFDGVIARAPALSFVALQLAANRIMRHLLGGPEGWLPPPAQQAFSRAVLEACDALDGLQDEMVSNVAACRFDPALLRCTGAGGDDCLSDAQLASVNTVLSALQLDFSLADGTNGYPGYPLSGAEDQFGGWPLWITGLSFDNRSSLLFTLQDQFFKYFVMQDPQFDSVTYSPGAAIPRLTALSTLLDATDPDLSAFAARGGKVILWHGWADYAISAYGTLRYYERVVAAAGGQDAADAFVRFYTSPAIDHTGTGRGAPLFDLLGALDAWVEDGTAPGDLIAYRLEEGTEIPFRPLCRYPTYPRYVGSGDPGSATSFMCVSS